MGPQPNVSSPRPIITAVEEEGSDQPNSFSPTPIITAVEEDDNEGSDVFELCSIATNPHSDQLNSSLGGSIGGSIGNSTSSRHKNGPPVRLQSSDQLNASLGKSIGNSTSSRQKSYMHRSVSTDSQLADVVVIPKSEDINVKYFIDYSRELGRGTNTIIRRCIERSTSKRYAVKSVRKADRLQYEHMRTEANLLTALDHPSVVGIYDTYEDDKHLHMVIELCKGGELYDHVMAKTKSRERHYSETEAAVIVLHVVDAIAYLHENNIVHRDLKLENILFKSKHKGKKDREALTEVRVIDFGLSRRYNTHRSFGSLKKLSSFVGTKYYVAPEVLTQSYTHAADLWSIGVLAYALLSARPPFTGRDDQEIYDKIKHCDETGVEFPSPDWDRVGADAKDFISRLLVKDAALRPSAEELKDHPWMISAAKEQVEIGNTMEHTKPSMFEKVFRFGGKGRAK